MPNSILTKNQLAFLRLFKDNQFLKENFYLTGGTALAAFYLQHRYSEDLDFFSEKEVDLLALNVFLKQAKKQLKASKVDFQQTFNRNLYFLRFDKEILKTEFTYFPFTRIEPGQKKFDINIDSILDIAANKLFSIYQRNYARDYIDLYFICRDYKYSVAELAKKARLKFDWHIDPLQLGAQFVKAEQAKDYPRMIKEISEKDWRDFFIQEAKKLKGEVLE